MCRLQSPNLSHPLSSPFPVGFMLLLTWEEDDGECQDGARSVEGPEPASAPWKSSTVVDAAAAGGALVPLENRGGRG